MEKSMGTFARSTWYTVANNWKANVPMDFSIDQETQEKARATRQFCEKHIDPYVANWDSGEAIATSVFEQMAALGLMSLRIPAENGGESASFVECGSLVYAVGRAGGGLAPAG